jgi:hypothetical protein
MANGLAWTAEPAPNHAAAAKIPIRQPRVQPTRRTSPAADPTGVRVPVMGVIDRPVHKQIRWKKTSVMSFLLKF